jgi:hypothetical protein
MALGMSPRYLAKSLLLKTTHSTIFLLSDVQLAFETAQQIDLA